MKQLVASMILEDTLEFWFDGKWNSLKAMNELGWKLILTISIRHDTTEIEHDKAIFEKIGE